jgi:5-methylcytosine-specific restriction endonuclease McrA
LNKENIKIIVVEPGHSLTDREFKNKFGRKRRTKKEIKALHREQDHYYVLSKSDRIKCDRNKYTYNQYIKSIYWDKIREKILKKNNYECSKCDSKAVQVHHKKYTRYGYERYKNLMPLCKHCHKDIHYKK